MTGTLPDPSPVSRAAAAAHDRLVPLPAPHDTVGLAGAPIGQRQSGVLPRLTQRAVALRSALGGDRLGSSWRCAKMRKQLGRILAPALQGAEANPLASSPDEMNSVYLGDKVALRLTSQALGLAQSGSQPWWLDDPSECGEMLRSIAQVLLELDTAEDPEELSPQEALYRMQVRERNGLARISWLVLGVDPEGIESPVSQWASPPQDWADFADRELPPRPGSIACRRWVSLD